MSSTDDIIKGKGYIIEKGYNPIKKKEIKIYRTSPEQKKEFLIKQKLIQRASAKNYTNPSRKVRV